MQRALRQPKWQLKVHLSSATNDEADRIYLLRIRLHTRKVLHAALPIKMNHLRTSHATSDS